MKISPKLDLIAKLVLLGLTLLSAGSLYKPSFISDAVQTDIVGVAHGFLIFLMSAYTIVTGSTASVSNIGKPLAAFAMFGLIAAMLLCAPGSAHAATRRLPIPLPPLRPISSIVSDVQGKISGAGVPGVTGKPIEDISKLYTLLQTVSLADLTAAKSDADANKDTVSAPCYAAIIALVTAQQSVDVTALQDKPHVVLTFQRGRDIVNAFRAGSSINVACAPMAEEIKDDVVSLVAKIAAGTVSLAAFTL